MEEELLKQQQHHSSPGGPAHQEHQEQRRAGRAGRWRPDPWLVGEWKGSSCSSFLSCFLFPSSIDTTG